MDKKLTPKQRAFIRAYLLCRNATKAAIEAGYSKKSAQVTGSRLLLNAMIAEALAANTKVVEEKFEITQEKIIQELAVIGFGNLADVVDEDGNILDSKKAKFLGGYSKSSSNSSGDQGWSESKSFSVSGQNKTKALELLGKHIGMWKNGDAGSGTDKETRAATLRRVHELFRKRRDGRGSGTDSNT